MRDLGRQGKDRILVVEEKILHEIENQPRTSTRGLANHLGVSQFVIWLWVLNAAQQIRQNRGCLNRVRARRGVLKLALHFKKLLYFFDVSSYAFTHNYSVFTLFASTLQIVSKIHDETQKKI
jgi:hypothetical protein